MINVSLVKLFHDHARDLPSQWAIRCNFVSTGRRRTKLGAPAFCRLPNLIKQQYTTPTLSLFQWLLRWQVSIHWFHLHNLLSISWIVYAYYLCWCLHEFN
jgi:hypothetical protein